MSNLDNCLEKDTDAVTVVCLTLTDCTEQALYQDHLIVWVEHVKALKDRAWETSFVLEAAMQLSASIQAPTTVTSINSNPGPSSRPDSGLGLISSNVKSRISSASLEADFFFFIEVIFYKMKYIIR